VAEVAVDGVPNCLAQVWRQGYCAGAKEVRPEAAPSPSSGLTTEGSITVGFRRLRRAASASSAVGCRSSISSRPVSCIGLIITLLLATTAKEASFSSVIASIRRPPDPRTPPRKGR
jgi:hypothetical protein